MNIDIAKKSDRERWDNVVKTSDLASPYQLFAWKEAVEKAYGHRSYYLMAVEGTEIVGVLPLIYMKPPMFSGQLVSLPFCDGGDLLVRDEQVKKQLLLEALSLGRTLGASSVELRGSSPIDDVEYLHKPVETLSHKVKMLLELPSSSETLWSSFKSKLRSQIRKSQKNGLEFLWGGKSELDDFYHVISMNMRELGSPVHSRKWYDEIMRSYGDNVQMGLVYLDERIVAAAIILFMNKTVSIPWASTLREFNRLSPNMLLYWKLLEYAADNGFDTFDFGRSTPDEGTYRFKEQWGAKPVKLYWHYVGLGPKRVEVPSSSSAKKDLIANMWKKLPLPVANCVGPAVRRYISL